MSSNEIHTSTQESSSPPAYDAPPTYQKDHEYTSNHPSCIIKLEQKYTKAKKMFSASKPQKMSVQTHICKDKGEQVREVPVQEEKKVK
ncbi:hypothetical protein GLAREA_02250 [Glarea lozoyensis ATCC 20868]|uniref:Uncharacterized protein n=1 Tax=Glarea lozoyensis (strain ATCC 20868 / MF5171) TaxID=1116229 RepID=S3DIF9_GLAL2|nr:uncharacterized protein GLAREA_02250 [Glarea lozoyensis ATCC 20868]EPE26338.1 hypothetical protein GLAREA_02250 [Glarea lozoyensis ATCC 20868]